MAIEATIVQGLGALLAKLLQEQTTVYLAVGSGIVGWDGEVVIPQPLTTQATLNNEVHRQLATLEYLDSSGVATGTPTTRVRGKITIPSTECLGVTLREMALFGAGPALLATPVISSTSTATTGGSLANATTYSYRVSAINANGETLPSTALTRLTGASGAAHTITINWSAITGATGYKIYGRVGGAEQLIATVGAVTTYVDTGASTPSGAVPTSNTTQKNQGTLLVAHNHGALTRVANNLARELQIEFLG